MAILDLPGEFGSDSRPAREPSGRKAWAKNPTGPGGSDGTRLDATLVNDLIGLIRTALMTFGVTASPGDDSALAQAMTAAALSLAGVADGIAPLDASSKVPLSNLPAIALTDTFAAASEAEMLALVAERGDVAIRSDVSKTFILADEPASTLGNWRELLMPTDVVQSVAGLTGAIAAAALKMALSLVAADITDSTSQGRSVLTASSYAAMKTLLAITAGDVSGLGALAAQNSVTTGQIADASAHGRSLIAAANYAAMLTLLGAQAALGYTPVNKAGDTMSGDLTIGPKDWPSIILAANAATAAQVVGRRGSSLRAVLDIVTNEAETGSNAGSNIKLDAYDDSGTYLGNIFRVARAARRFEPERLKDNSAGYISVKAYGATGDGITDDTTAITAARAIAVAEGKALYFPAGTYINNGSLYLWTGAVVIGDGPHVSILKIKTGAVAVAINAHGCNRWQVRDLQIDGNFASTSSVGIYTEDSIKFLIDNVYLQRCSYGVHINGPDSDPTWGMEGTVTNVVVDNCNYHGIRFDGPHDSYFANVIVIDAGQNANNAYSGFYIGAAANGRFVNCHAWTRSGTANRMAYACDVNGYGCEFWGCHFEGAYTANVHINGEASLFDTCRFYAAWNGVNVILRQPFCRINALLLDPGAGRPACKGIVMGSGAGDNVSSCYIDIIASNQQAGILDFTYDDGGNTILCRGYNAAGTNLVGAPAANSNYQIYISGGSSTQIYNP